MILDLTLPGGMGGKEALKKVDRDRSDGERDRLQRLRDGCDDEPLSGFRIPRRDREAVRSRGAGPDRARSDRVQPRQSGAPITRCRRLGSRLLRSASSHRLARTGISLAVQERDSSVSRDARRCGPAAYDSKIEGNVIFTRLDAAMNWMRKNSLWPMPMGLACCAIELMATASARFDISRFGAEVMRFSPRQCDVMIVAGTVTYKMALAVKRIYEQMPEPKWVIAMGACASSGGMYRSYAVLQGIDQLLPVDVYVSGARRARKRCSKGYETAGEDRRRTFLPRPKARLVEKLEALSLVTDMPDRELLDSLGQLLGAKILEKIEFRGETTFLIARANLREVAKFCKDELSSITCSISRASITLANEPRFEVVYELYSMTLGDSSAAQTARFRRRRDGRHGLRHLADGQLARARDLGHDGSAFQRPSRFAPHPDVGGYPYFPLRKEFPLEGLPSDMPDVAFTSAAPMEGGPFVTQPSTATTKDREPRARSRVGDRRKRENCRRRAFHSASPGEHAGS